MRKISGVVVVGVLGVSFAPPALAAFPGANGLLAVQPTSGRGIVLVGANGRGAHRICTGAPCNAPHRPRWSPDGRALVVAAGAGIRIVYPDGTCMDCQFGSARNPSFEPTGNVISFVQGTRVTADGIDGLRRPKPPVGPATDAVWSPDGRLAVVRGGMLWAGRPGRLRKLVAGSEPSWSPSGDRIAAVQRGWVVIVRLRDRFVQRVTRGTAPAFSPDGRWIAFVAPNHRLMIISTRGKHPRPRPVGRLFGLSVDWQPKPAGANRGCVAPPGSTVIARNPQAVVTGDGLPVPPADYADGQPIAYMGCLQSDGRERLLEKIEGNNIDGASWIGSALIAPPYAALVKLTEDEHYGGSGSTVQIFDLQTGDLRKDLGGESAGCPDATGSCSRLDQIVLGSDGVSAAHTLAVDPLGFPSTPLLRVACAPSSMLCVAVDDASHLLTSRDPSAGNESWTSGTLGVPPQTGPDTVACPSQSLCVGAATAIWTSSDPAGGASTWTESPLPGTPTVAGQISCPTAMLCVVTRFDGSIATSTNPAGGAQAWTITQLDPGNALAAVVCSTEPRCFITDSAGTVFTSTDPTGGPAAWTVSATTPPFQSGACPTTNLCVTVHNQPPGGSTFATTTDPGAASWTRQPVPGNVVLYSVSCPSASLCVVAGADGALGVSTDPSTGTWTQTTVDFGLQLTSTSCASVSLCVATDANGKVVVATNPSADPSAWVPTLLEGDPCTATAQCTIERIEASDKNGLRTVDVSEVPGLGTFLTGLALNGDALSWSDGGAARTSQLTPP